MSFQTPNPSFPPKKQSGLKPKVNIPQPPVPLPFYSRGYPQLRPQEPNARTMPYDGFGQFAANPHVDLPVPGSDSQPLWASLPRNQHPSARAQAESSDVLEDQLRNMILSNESPSGQQQTASRPSMTDTHPQVSTTPRQSNFRRLNQAQRKQQSQQMQLTPHYTPRTTSEAELRHSGQLRQNGAQGSNGPPGVHPHALSNPVQYNANQRQPHGFVSQPRSLFDPNVGANRFHPGIHSSKVQIADNLAQLSYIDQLASTKIQEVQISPEELLEKQCLKQRLNEVCRNFISDHELNSNPGFPVDSIELKSFGSLSVGFATKESDMDLVLVSPQSKPELSSSKSPIPRMIEKALLDLGYGARLLTQTRVPIIKFCESPGPELAAHLRLARLHWEKENETLRQPAKSEIKDEQSVASAETGVNFQLQDKSERSPAAQHDPTWEQSDEVNSAVVPVVGADTRSTLQGEPENEYSWVSQLSDYELTGLFKAALKEHRFEPHQKAIISASLQKLEDQSASRDSNTLQESREALWGLSKFIKKFRVPSKPDLEFPKSGVGTQCDINFSNQVALHNSLLLKCYSLCDPRVREMVLFVKAWTKRRKINSPYHGTLNSYGYVLMVLHFLMNVAQPPLIFNLQLATDLIRNDPLSTQEATLDGYNIQFFRNEAALQEMAQNGAFCQNKESLGSLLRSFFQFYANPPRGKFSWKDDVLSLRTKSGILTKVGKGWVGARTERVELGGPGQGQGQKTVSHHYVVAIEDPFETGHNVARTVFFNGVVAIRDEFRRAADLILSAGMDPQTGLQDFFAEGKRNENLQHRNGPPRKDFVQKKNSGPVKDVS